MLSIKNSTLDSIIKLFNENCPIKDIYFHSEQIRISGDVIFSVEEEGIFLYCVGDNENLKIKTKERLELYGMFGQKMFIIPQKLKATIEYLRDLIKKENGKIDIGQIYRENGNELFFTYNTEITLNFKQIEFLNLV